MSSCRCKHHCCHTAIHACENKSFKGSRSSKHNVRGLLRLNSTGEITSASQVSNCQNWHDINHGRVNPKDSPNHNQHSYKNLVENLSMGSLINSASAYLDSASSYFGNFCPYKTAKGLTRSNSDGSSLSYLKNMISGVSKPTSVSSPDMRDFEHLLSSCECAKSNIPEDTGKSLNWTGNIFGALQCSLLTNCPAKLEKMRGVNTEKYIPPQRRYHNEKYNSASAAVDPKLTPYNAKLLEKSKKCHPHANVKKDIFAKKYHCNNKSNNMANIDPPKNSTDKSAKIHSQLKEDESDNDSGRAETDLETDITCIQKDTMETETKCDTEKDWFDYECVDAKCIPISIDKLQLASQKCEENINTQDESSTSPQLHSWFSIENANETAKSDSSPTKDAANICDTAKVSECLEREAENNCESESKQLENMNSKQTNNQTSISTVDSELQQDITETDHSKSDSKSYVLYVRSIGRRGKPSAKKRRRQRAQQNDKNDQTSCHISSSSVKPNSALHGGNAVAFILGYSANSSEKDAHSFHVSCDIDDESDWSDSDIESDETCSSIEDENMFDNGLGFQCNNPLLGMQCFQVTFQPQQEEVQSSNSSDIDNINLLWKVQVSVKPENPKKKSSTSKKVNAVIYMYLVKYV